MPATAVNTNTKGSTDNRQLTPAEHAEARKAAQNRRSHGRGRGKGGHVGPTLFDGIQEDRAAAKNERAAMHQENLNKEALALVEALLPHMTSNVVANAEILRLALVTLGDKYASVKGNTLREAKISRLGYAINVACAQIPNPTMAKWFRSKVFEVNKALRTQPATASQPNRELANA